MLRPNGCCVSSQLIVWCMHNIPHSSWGMWRGMVYVRSPTLLLVVRRRQVEIKDIIIWRRQVQTGPCLITANAELAHSTWESQQAKVQKDLPGIDITPSAYMLSFRLVQVSHIHGYHTNYTPREEVSKECINRAEPLSNLTQWSKGALFWFHCRSCIAMNFAFWAIC